MTIAEEKKLLKKVKSDPEAFSKVYVHYYPKIFNYIIKRIQHFQTAQDITSETFYRAFSRLWQFQWRNIPFSAWLYRIATNEINTFLRKNRQKKASLDELMAISAFQPSNYETPKSELENTQQIMESHQDFIEAKKKISMLPVKYRNVITLKYLKKKKVSEIGGILGTKEGTVKSLLFRGLGKLKYLLEEERRVKNTSSRH